MKSIQLVIFSFFAFALFSCGGNDAKNPGTDPKVETEIPDVTGDFSYSFSPSKQCGGECDEFIKYESCETSQKFTNKRAYCLGLRDGSLNKGCARNERKEEYIKNCASDFDDINVGGVSSTGGDERVGSCSWKIPVTTGKAYCNALKDESQHKYCRWDDRRIDFKQFGCEGAFSELSESLSVHEDRDFELNGWYYYQPSHFTTYKTYKKTFKVTLTSPAILSISYFQLKERTCEQKGMSKVLGTILNLNTNEKFSFDPKAKTPLMGGSSYSILVEVQNPGLCKELHYDYRIEVK